MRVITLKEHGNAYGPVYRRGEDGVFASIGESYRKLPRDAYDHPSPEQLIDDRVVALPGALDGDGDGRPGGSRRGVTRKRKPRGTPKGS